MIQQDSLHIDKVHYNTKSKMCNTHQSVNIGIINFKFKKLTMNRLVKKFVDSDLH